LDISVQDGFERKIADIKDRIESSGDEFFNKVRNGYLEIANEQPRRIKIIDAMDSIESIYEKIIEHVNQTI
jgi:dTMP kinase